MSSTAALEIPKVRFREPERNLPGRTPRTITPETRFTIQFARAYIEQHQTLHRRTDKSEFACARQVAVNGFGIADLLTIVWQSNDAIYSLDDLKSQRPTMRAFEIKLCNWRKGMTQAHRYRYFSNAAILVLPIVKCNVAREYLRTFKKIRVGLWGFDPSSSRIVAFFTPRPCSAIEPKYQQKALELIARTSKALPFP